MAQKEYKRRKDNAAKKVHWNLCKKNRLEYTEKWYEHVPEGAVENDEVKLLWDVNIQCDNVNIQCDNVNIQCDNVMEARKPDIVVVDKKEHKGKIIDIAVPVDVLVAEKEREKVEKYHELKREIRILWKLRRVEVVPLVIGAL